MKPIEKTPAETKQFNIKKTIVDFIFLIAGCFFGAFGSVGIMVPNGLSSGGLSGLSRILQAIFPGLDYSVTFGALTIRLAFFSTLTSSRFSAASSAVKFAMSWAKRLSS